MARQTIRRRAARNPFKVEADRIAYDHGGNRRKIEAGLRRIADSFQIDPHKSKDPDELFEGFPFTIFLDGIGSTSVDNVLALIASVDPVTVARRELALRFLFRDQVPLYTIDQLALRLAGFVEYLRQHRDFLVRYGLPPCTFRRCRWLYVQMGRLNDTKRAAIPVPLNEPVQNEQPNRWLRLVPTMVAARDGHLVLSVGYERCDYDDASLLKGLDQQDAHRLEETRPKMLDLKIGVLEMLASMLRDRTPDEIWPQAVQLITDALLADEADFMLRMDRHYMGFDARQCGAEGTDPKMIPGGLTNLFEVIGHCEKELDLGPLATTAKLFQAAFPSLTLQRRLRAQISSTAEPYFSIAAHGGDSQWDQIVDNFISTAQVEEEFWGKYRQRVNNSLLNDFYAEVVVRQRIKRPLAEKFIPEVTSFARYAAEKLTAGSPIHLSLTDKDEGPGSASFVFVRKGKLWQIGDAHSTVPVRHRKGMQFISHLLRKPGEHLHVAQLDMLINPPPPAMQGELSYADLDDARETKSIAVADRDALRELNDERIRLRAEIDEAKRNSDLAIEERAKQELKNLMSAIRKIINIRGHAREFRDQNERLRRSISKCIKEVIKEIQSVHAGVGGHLRGAIRTGEYCVYDPRPVPEWQLD